jgi:long-chain fatty acid transport protein
MSTASHMIRFTALAVGVVGALAAGHANAAAFQLKENSAKGLGRAFAGSTSAWGDASVVATNPASMRLLDGRQIQGDLSLISFSADFEKFGARNSNGTPVSGGNGGDAGMIAPVPAAYFYTPVGDDMHFGMSLTVPFGFKTEYDRDWVGRYHGVTTDLKAIDLGASFSYDVNPYVSFGASVFVEHLTIEISNALDMGSVINGQAQSNAVAQLLRANPNATPAQIAGARNAGAMGAAAQGFYPGSADGFVTIEGDNNAFGYTLGTTLSPSEDTNIAFTYRSKVKHKITGGTADFSVPGNVGAALGQPASGLFVSTGGKAELTLPASASVSVTHRVNDRWTVMGDLSRTAWKSAFDTVTVDFASNQPDSVLAFHYDDTTFGSIGAEYKYSDTVTLRGGVAYDESPTSYGHRDVRVPDVTRKWLSLGASWQLSEQTEFNVGYTHLFTNEPAINVTSATGNVVQGKYDVGGDILAASINYKF